MVELTEKEKKINQKKKKEMEVGRQKEPHHPREMYRELIISCCATCATDRISTDGRVKLRNFSRDVSFSGRMLRRN